MADLSSFATTEFYAGKPDTATPSLLRWSHNDFAMEVRADQDGGLTAVILAEPTSRMEWTCRLKPGDLKEQIDGCLEDASRLGRITNWSSDE